MKLLVVLLGMFSSSAALAGNLITNSESAIGAEVMLRQIADNKHFGKDALRVVRLALEGSGTSNIRSDISSMECEPELGVRSCLISLKASNGNSFDVEVKIFQGKIISGGPVKVEE